MKTENTFCQRSTLILGDLERGDIDAHEAEWKLIDPVSYTHLTLPTIYYV